MAAVVKFFEYEWLRDPTLAEKPHFCEGKKIKLGLMPVDKS
jgi:hypothetical protein